MLRSFSPVTKKIQEIDLNEKIDTNAIWFDLFNPLPEEIEAIERALEVEIPTSEKMQEIESSSRFYQEQETLFMTINMVAQSDSDHPVCSPMTLILNQKYLITIRYIDPKPFLSLTKKIQKNFNNGITSDLLFITLLELIVDRTADIIEKIGGEVEHISDEIFNIKTSTNDQRTLKETFSHLGKQGDLSTKVRLSLENINRLLKYLEGQPWDSRYKSRLTILGQDVLSITDHILFIFHKINFLLDATLGMINIEQNAVVKILSGAAVIFLPPTLIASIYGMNFSFMPELAFPIAYPIILFVMVMSAVIPYLYFKRKGWL